MITEEDFWLDQKRAQEILEKRNLLSSWIDEYEEIVSSVQNTKMFFEEAKALNDEEFIQELEGELAIIEERVKKLEMRKMLSSPMDNKGCYLSINAGAGGTESCDWAEMLSRMYQRWAQKKSWKIEVLDKLEGEVAGIKSITFKIEGPFAYGYAKSEKGVHRLVRISPFDSNAKRHTSFASVDIIPVIEEEIDIQLRPEDLRVDTYRSSGAGGQHVNVTDSAVRITHLPTGMVVSCQRERSQLQNKETCLKMLKAKLYEKELTEKREALEKIGGEKRDISWGNQIRNYVFQPYTLVKDTRTKYEEGNIQAVMDGEIDNFIYAYLKEFA